MERNFPIPSIGSCWSGLAGYSTPTRVSFSPQMGLCWKNWWTLGRKWPRNSRKSWNPMNQKVQYSSPPSPLLPFPIESFLLFLLPNFFLSSPATQPSSLPNSLFSSSLDSPFPPSLGSVPIKSPICRPNLSHFHSFLLQPVIAKLAVSPRFIVYSSLLCPPTLFTLFSPQIKPCYHTYSTGQFPYPKHST